MIMLSDCMITKQHMEISSIKAAAPGLGWSWFILFQYSLSHFSYNNHHWKLWDFTISSGLIQVWKVSSSLLCHSVCFVILLSCLYLLINKQFVFDFILGCNLWSCVWSVWWWCLLLLYRSVVSGRYCSRDIISQHSQLTSPSLLHWSLLRQQQQVSSPAAPRRSSWYWLLGDTLEDNLHWRQFFSLQWMRDKKCHCTLLLCVFNQFFSILICLRNNWDKAEQSQPVCHIANLQKNDCLHVLC